jgi:signal transduction histidine kinase
LLLSNNLSSKMTKACRNISAGRRMTGSSRVFCFLSFLLALFALERVPAKPTNPPACLTTAQQVRELEPATAGENTPVRVLGVVTYFDAPLHNLFIQDATAGIFVLVTPETTAGIHAGEKVEVTGVCDKGDYAPIIKASAIRILGVAPLPTPLRVSIDQLFAGNEDSQWLEVRGVVRSATILDGRECLNLAMNGQSVMTYVENLDETNAAKLINTTIRLRGVCYSRYNMKRQLRAPWLAVSSMGDITVERQPPRRPEEIAIASLAQFNSSGFYGNLVKVSGVVTLQKPDGTLFIQNQGYGLYVQLAQSISLNPGDRVVVTGYSALGQYVPTVEDATVQFLSHGESPSPTPANLDTLLNGPETFDGVLVQLKASLLNLVESAGRQTLVLQSSNTIFTATYENIHADERFKLLRLGSEVALTGVFTSQSQEKWVPGLAQSREAPDSTIPYSPPESVQLFLRSFDDVIVIQQPPWWTLPRLLWAIGIMTFILLAGLVWVVVLGRRVRQQTRIIEEKIKLAGVLEERDRIAREFHDTLEQELAAITMQLDTVEAQLNGPTTTVRQLLGLARNMLRHSLSEARRSVWDLRSHLLENSDLVTALIEMAAPLGTAAGVEIAVSASGVPRKLPAVIEHNLLRVTQEALANALKYSGAKAITVSLNYELPKLRLCIQDNGGGFDFSTVAQASSGHFGLLDMRERAEKIGADFSITTQPGNGTEILLAINNVNHFSQRGSNGSYSNEK